MEKRNKIFLGITITVTILIVILCIFAIIQYKNDEANKVVNEISKFAEEYEGYNGMGKGDNIHVDLDINDNATVVYKEIDEVVELAESEDVLLYFGFANCQWCRSMIPSLLNSSEKTGGTIYYIDIEEIRDLYAYEDGEVVLKEEGAEGYSETVELLKDVLDNYVVRDEDGEEYDTGTYRIYAPTVVAIKDGKPVASHIGTFEGIEDPYIVLTEDQSEELQNIYDDMFGKIMNVNCESSDELC